MRPNGGSQAVYPAQLTTVTLEVGAGDGLFLTKLAGAHPERQFIALDRKSDQLYVAKLA